MELAQNGLLDHMFRIYGKYTLRDGPIMIVGVLGQNWKKNLPAMSPQKEF